MRAFWGFGVVALTGTVLGGCLGDNLSDVTEAQEAAALAAALVEEVDFEDATLVDGDLPDTTADDLVLSPVGEIVVVSPGESSIMAVEVENTDEDADPVVATLIKVANAEKFAEVMATRKSPVLGDDLRDPENPDGDPDAQPPAAPTAKAVRVENRFVAREGICDNLCNKVFATEVQEVSKKESGAIGRRSRRTLALDCRARGKAARCTSDTEDDIPAEMLTEMMNPSADSGGDAGMGGGDGDSEPPIFVESTCVQDVLTSAETVPECAQCLCDIDEQVLMNCDQQCWDVLNCIEAAGCDPADQLCIAVQCGEFTEGADLNAVMAVGALAPRCEEFCAPKDSQPEQDGGVSLGRCEDTALPGASFTCQSCVCAVDSASASRCDEGCAALIQCAADCDNNALCISTNCGDIQADTEVASTVGSIMQEACFEDCQPAVEPDLDAGM